MDTALIVDGEVTSVWRNKAADVVADTLPEGEHDLIEVAPDGGAEGGPVISGQLWDGETFTNPPTPPAPPRRIAKGVVVERLTAAGKADEFMAALTARPIFMLAWITPSLGLLASDADLIEILGVIGADAEAITAA